MSLTCRATKLGMPRISYLISDDFLLTNLDKISASIQINPYQVAMILGVSTETLKKNRGQGMPPRFVKEKSCIRYRVGDVREYLSQKPVFSNTGEVAVEQLKQKGRLLLK